MIELKARIDRFLSKNLHIFNSGNSSDRPPEFGRMIDER